MRDDARRRKRGKEGRRKVVQVVVVVVVVALRCRTRNKAKVDSTATAAEEEEEEEALEAAAGVEVDSWRPGYTAALLGVGFSLSLLLLLLLPGGALLFSTPLYSFLT